MPASTPLPNVLMVKLPRTGSTYLAYLLGSHPRISFHHEYLNPYAKRRKRLVSGPLGIRGVRSLVGQAIARAKWRSLEKLLAKGKDGRRPRLGLKVADAGKVAQKVGAVPVFGALVGTVSPGSPGERAGIRKGDVITEINMRPVHNAGDVEQAVANLSAGGRAAIVFLRGDKTLKAEITV